jgi:cysteine desulfurase/selenocysteine lyase
VSFDPQDVRPDFPPLRDGRLLYFDNACMALRPQAVIDAVTAYYTEYPACGERSLHRLGQRVDAEVSLAREAARRLLGAKRVEEIVFTQNTTHAINLVALCFPFAGGDVVVTSDQEHNSNLLPWQQLSRAGVQHQAVPFGNLEALRAALTERVKLVSMVMTSNLDGASIDAKRTVQVAHDAGIPVLLDAAQAAPHQEIDVRSLDVDFLACSGHKMMGPSGTGILYGKRQWLERLRPTLVGGGTVTDSTLQAATYADVPERFEAGLQNYAGIIGLRAAIEYLERIGRAEIQAHEHRLTRQLHEGLARYDDIRIFGPPPEGRTGITSFAFEGIDVHDVCMLLDRSAGIAVRSGRHCVHSWFNAHHVEGTVRASLYLYNTEQEVAAFLQALAKVHDVLA